MSWSRIVSVANTRSGSMMIDLGILHPAKGFYVFNLGSEDLQKTGPRRPVDDLMVARQGQGDRIYKFQGAVAPDGFDVDRADAENRDLRRIQQRCEALDAEAAEITDREGG